MAAAPAKSLSVLLSEGSSTSAREAVTLLGRAGHRVEICDPAPFALARFSRYVSKYHRCPPLGQDPAGYLAFVEDLLMKRHFDLLLPIHEQGLPFARVQQRLGVGLALPSFDSYRLALDKARFSRLLGEIGLAQPPTRIVATMDQLRTVARVPCVIKTAIGTASRGVWIVRDEAALRATLQELAEVDGLGDEVLVQDFVEGAVEQAQAVFCRGKLLGLHATRRLAEGAGGGAALKQSVRRPALRHDLSLIGAKLEWHGALSVDYIQTDEDAAPLYIDCNPRLVEPMAADLAGVDLLGHLLKVSQGELPPQLPDGRVGVRSHLAMQALFGTALRGGTRRAILRECGSLAAGKAYSGSVEELTPWRRDFSGALPLAATALLLLISPNLAKVLARRGFGAHLLGPDSIRRIEHVDFAATTRAPAR